MNSQHTNSITCPDSSGFASHYKVTLKPKAFKRVAILPSYHSIFYVSLIFKENLTNNGSFPKNRRTEISKTD